MTLLIACLLIWQFKLHASWYVFATLLWVLWVAHLLWHSD